MNNSQSDWTQFNEGQRLTRGERRIAIGCLIVAAFFVWAFVDVHRHGPASIGAWVWFFCWPALFLTFGFACIVATHGKWKLTLSALLCFASTWLPLFLAWFLALSIA